MSGMTWALKAWPEYYAAIEDESKPFEVRKDDRPGGYQVGDILEIWEYFPEEERYSLRKVRRYVSFVLRDFPGLAPGYVVMGLVPL